VCTITLVHHEQTVRLSCNRKWCEALGMGVDYIDDHTIVFPVGSQLAAGPHADTPVHYEQTVRPRVHRYTMSKQSGTGHTGTL
jgi:hypothetical protein